MQGEVHFTPLSVSINQGEPPSQSTYRDTIVRSIILGAQIETLQQSLTYFKQMQSKQLADAKKQGMPALQFVRLPHGMGSSEEVANAATYNVLQSNVATAIKHQIALTKNLQVGADPKTLADLESDLQILQAISAGFPKLSQEHVDQLKNMVQKQEGLAKQLPSDIRAQFVEGQNNMLLEMGKTNEAALSEFQLGIQDIQKKQTQTEQQKATFEQIVSTVQRGDLSKALPQVVNVLNSYRSLPPEQQKATSEALQYLFNAPTESGKPLGELFALQFVCSSLTKPMSAEHLTAQVQANLHQLPNDSSEGQALYRKVESYIESPNFPSNLVVDGKNLTVEKDGLHAPEVSPLLLATPIASNALPKTSDPFDTLNANYEEQSGGLSNSYTQFKGAPPSSQSNAPKTSAASGGSLANQFYNTVLGKYMPGQQQYLMELSEVLMFDNFGAEVGNALLNYTTSFSAAQNNYNFNSQLQGGMIGNEIYKGNPSSAEAALKNEQDQAQSDINSTQSLINEIKAKISAIQNNPQFTQAQKNQMIDKLKPILSSSYAALTHLKSLSAVLNGVTIDPQPPPPLTPVGFFLKYEGGISTTIAGTISKYENAVINGVGGDGSGLSAIGSAITNFQKGYADQSQNQMMILQMRMTEIQQEWTVTSTALQLLFQSYMTVAQGIYK